MGGSRDNDSHKRTPLQSKAILLCSPLKRSETATLGAPTPRPSSRCAAVRCVFQGTIYWAFRLEVGEGVTVEKQDVPRGAVPHPTERP